LLKKERRVIDQIPGKVHQDPSMRSSTTLLSKIWNSHIVSQRPNQPAVVYIDQHLVHEVTSPQAFTTLRERGAKVRRPDLTLATMDHSIPTEEVDLQIVDPAAAAQLKQLETNCREFGIRLLAMDSDQRGIVHVVGPELGLTQPGMTIVCGDSHTSTHGAFGALAFGIGTSEVAHVLATQCLLQSKPKSFEVRVDGMLKPGVTGKDLILALIAEIGVQGGVGHVFEYCGSAIRALGMEARLTVCNMSIEAGARAGMIAPDDHTFEYLAGRELAPEGKEWERAIERWQHLPSDEGAIHDRSVVLDGSSIEPMITYGTNPGMVIPIRAAVPKPDEINDLNQRTLLENALTYMDLPPGKPLLGRKIDVVFIGSCTNSRISDLREAARIFKNQKVADDVRVLVVPGSQAVKQQAEEEGLHHIFTTAGAEWRQSGCSMCIAMNGDQLHPGEYAVSTSNRNFEGRQGPGGRTFLASPLTAAAAAVTGEITDARTLL
jgi:3-isopropylmalate/(R)-2-methylmalate dehydratase large subunit